MTAAPTGAVIPMMMVVTGKHISKKSATIVAGFLLRQFIFTLYKIQEFGGGSREGLVLFPSQYMSGDAFRLEGAEADFRHGADGDGTLHADEDANALFDEQQTVGGEIMGGDNVQLFFG